MIQRIQSVYLFVIGILMVLPLCVPIARVVVPNDTNYDFFAYGIVEKSAETSFVSYYWALFILSLFTILLPLITIFLYKKTLFTSKALHRRDRSVDRVRHSDVVSHPAIRS